MLLIDTYNVLHVVGVLPPELAGIEIDGLVDLLLNSRYRREAVILVCDGAPPGNLAPAPGSDASNLRLPAKVIYSGPNRSADDVIARLIRQSTAPRRLRVVSSDRAVLREAKRRRCPVLSSEMLLHQLAIDFKSATAGEPVSRKPEPRDAREVIPPDVLAEAQDLAQRMAESMIASPAETKGETVPPQADDRAIGEPQHAVEEEVPGDSFPESILREAESWEARLTPTRGVSKQPPQGKAPRTKEDAPRRVDFIPPEIVREAESMIDAEETEER